MEKRKMFRGVFLTLCVAVGVAVGDSAIDVRSKRVSIDITTPTRLFPLVGPLASHVSRGIVELSLRVPVEMPNTASVNIALMTEDQFLSANRTSCWVPALARGDSGDTLDVSITYGNYYVCAVYCGPENIVPLEVSVTALFSVPRDSAGSIPGRTPASQLARQQWWLSGLFLVQLALACFAFYGFPRGWEQRIFWMPYAVVVGSYLVLSIAEFSVQLEGNFLFLYPVRVMRVFRALWRLGASVYIGWICVGSYLLGAKARPAVWVRWGVLFVGCTGAIVPVLSFDGDAVAVQTQLVGGVFWTVCFWGACVWLCRLHMRVNKRALDGERPPNAASAHDELVKRFALRLMRGSASVGFALSLCATAVVVADVSNVAACDQLCDAALMLALFAVLLGMVLNFNSPTFVRFDGRVELRRRVVGAMANVMTGMRERAAQRREEQARRAAAAPSAPPLETSTDRELLGSTTDAEYDVTEPDGTPLINMANSNN